MEILFLLIAYLFGSISCAILVCKLFHLPDPRLQGSGNPGATNVLRIAGKKIAIIVLLGDALKGVIPVLLAKSLHMPLLWQGYIALAAVIRPLFPIFFKFNGGKGVATFFGTLLALSWPLGSATLLVWLIVASTFRYSSLAAMVASVLSPFIGLIFYPPTAMIPIALIAIVILYRHKTNFQRLFTGTETKIGEKK